MKFKEYLEKQQYSISTIEGYLKIIKHFVDWAEDEQIKEEEMNYQNILAYVRFCSENGNSKHYQNQHLTVIRHYFNHLVKEGKIKDNVATGIYIKGVSRRIPHDLLSDEQLQNVYEKYPSKTLVEKRNKIILGLLIFQGLTASEVRKLEPEHLQLTDGRIYIAGGRKSNSRTLPLAGHQVLSLHNYQTELRPLFKALYGIESHSFFMTQNGSKSLNNIFTLLMKKVRSYEPNVESVKQIRASVITIWLEKFNLREAQYMAGHRYVSSTERYMTTNLDDLQQDVNSFHPF